MLYTSNISERSSFAWVDLALKLLNVQLNVNVICGYLGLIRVRERKSAVWISLIYLAERKISRKA